MGNCKDCVKWEQETKDEPVGYCDILFSEKHTYDTGGLILSMVCVWLFKEDGEIFLDEEDLPISFDGENISVPVFDYNLKVKSKLQTVETFGCVLFEKRKNES